MGESREEAILHACPLRIRPVMMTTLTTILAMVPMALGIGDTNEMMSDMGVTMISGMVISTVVTLLFTPVYYSVDRQSGPPPSPPQAAPCGGHRCGDGGRGAARRRVSAGKGPKANTPPS